MGHEVVGLFMKNWEDDDDSEYCSSNADFVDAAAVADVLGIEIEHVNFAAEYKDRVFAEFLREYQAGRTPNPDVLCNAEIKFKAFLDHAMRLGAEKIATGHYARVRERDGRFELLKGLDAAKDQSYFLHRLNQAQLSQDAVPGRRAEEDRGAPDRRRDRPAESRRRRIRPASASSASGRSASSSTATCATNPAPIEDERGRRVGEHVGLSFYTLGQRQGLGIGGIKDRARRGGASTRPGSSRARTCSATCSSSCRATNTRLLASRLQADDASWVAGSAPPAGRYAAKTRYRQADAACTLRGARPGASRSTSTHRSGRSRPASRRCSTTARSASAAA